MSDLNLPEGPLAFVFPGQGSQFVGMAGDLAATSARARALLDQADEVVGFPLTALMADGPEEELGDTVNAQPAILAVSVAALEAVRERLAERDRQLAPAFVAGHSLGEFSALVAAGSIEFSTALSLVRERGRLMKQAGADQPGGMAAVLGLDDAAIAAVCEEASAVGIVVPANRNCPGQIVISGEVAALERAMELAKANGAKRVARLNVSIASHSPLMADANRAFADLVAAAPIEAPSFPIIGNVEAQPLTSVDGIRRELMQQMERPVDWTGSVRSMVDLGAGAFIEIGPGTVLSGLIKRTDRSVTTLGMGDLGLGLRTLTAR